MSVHRKCWVSVGDGLKFGATTPLTAWTILMVAILKQFVSDDLIALLNDSL